MILLIQNPPDTCEFCRTMAPQDHRQWEHRMRRIRAAPDVGIYPCPRCGQTAYMTIEPPPDVEEFRPLVPTWMLAGGLGILAAVFSAWLWGVI